MVNVLYRYNIEFVYTYGSKEYKMTSVDIKNVIIDYDYDNKNMPIMIAKVYVNKKILDDMILNQTNKTIMVTFSKTNANDTLGIQEDYIKDNFIYFLYKDVNALESIDYTKDDDENDKVKLVTMGLMNLNVINNNKQVFNGIYKNTTMTNIIVNSLSNMNLLLEPLTNQEVIPLMPIPPINSVTNLIAYLDNNTKFYNNSYRLFHDYTKTYILDYAGNGTRDKGELSNTLIFDIKDITTNESMVNGIGYDPDSKSYNITISKSELKFIENTSVTRSFNTIYGIGNFGETKQEEIKSNVSNLTSNTNMLIERTNDMKSITTTKNKIENSLVTICITKEDLDTSILTMNKVYKIRSYDFDDRYNGEYILSKKQDIYVVYEQSFKLCSILTFRKKSS